MANKTIKNKLQDVKCFLLDMDGTIYLEDHLLPGAMQFLSYLDSNGIAYVFLTNNSSKAAGQYVSKLAKMGIQIDPSSIITSGEATAANLGIEHQNSSLFVVGTKALQDLFRSCGFRLVEDEPDVVVLGFDTTLTYEKLWKSCNFIREGCLYIATHPDINCPTKEGFMPDIGSFIALIQASTGREPDKIIGKPYEPMVEAIEERTGFSRREMCMIGDRLYTDIMMGKYGMKTIMVLSGEAQLDDVSAAEVKPDFILNNIGEVLSVIT